MSDPIKLRDPWLVAAWPGMGDVALLAGGFLFRQLRALRTAELDVEEFFEPLGVSVEDGLATPGGLPRGVFYEWKDPRGRRDLLIFMADAQPRSGGYRLCEKVVDYAKSRGVGQLFTFAALATQLNPGEPARTFAAATDPAALERAQAAGAAALDGGQINGLNGLLLAVGAERGVRGTCLLGELPYFATTVPSPRAAHAVLSCFLKVAGVEADLTGLERQAEIVEDQMRRAMEELGLSVEGPEGQEEPGEPGERGEEEPAGPEGDAERAKAAGGPPRLEPRVERRIEALFDQARRDRSKAVELKQELDRLGVFKRYEDRFLDLFRNAG